MNPGVLLLVIFIGVLCLNVPIAFALGVAAMAVMYFCGTFSLDFMAQISFNSADSFTLLAVPFFVLAGDIMVAGGISKRLVNFGTVMLSSTRGALGMITVFVSMIFAAISGSGPATVAAVGGILLPAMIDKKYDKAFSGTLAAAAGSLGPVIPPSLCMIMYGVVVGVSITDLFLGGMIPGILMGIALMIYVHHAAVKHGYGEDPVPHTWQEKLQAFNDAKWSLLVPIIILGGIYTGVFTPTESAVIACDYALIIGIFVYKELSLKDIPRILINTTLTSGTMIIILACAAAFGKVLTMERIPALIATSLLSVTDNVFVILLLINIFLLLVGMLMESLAAIIILAPLLVTIVKPLGVDPLHFGIIMTINLAIGMFTPPVGVNLFVASRIGNIPIESMFKWVLPMVGTLVTVLLLVTYIPGISTFLPRVFK